MLREKLEKPFSRVNTQALNTCITLQGSNLFSDKNFRLIKETAFYSPRSAKRGKIMYLRVHCQYLSRKGDNDLRDGIARCRGAKFRGLTGRSNEREKKKQRDDNAERRNVEEFDLRAAAAGSIIVAKTSRAVARVRPRA